MGLYKEIMEVAEIVRKDDNLDLYKKLLDLSSQALDLQEEISRLREDNGELKKKKDISEKIVRHKLPYVTLRDDLDDLYYCSHCWDGEQIVIQLNCADNGCFECPHCHAKGLYDTEKNKQYHKRQAENIANMNRSLHRKNIFDGY